MNGIMVALLFLSLGAGEARAERYILKNPKSPAVIAHAIRSFQFGQDRYIVVNTPKFSPLARSLAKNAEKVSLDPQISLPQEAPSSWWDPHPNAWQVKALHYDQLPAAKDGQGVIVAVIDTGVDYTHPNLQSHMWVNPGEIPRNGIDDDKNGYIDDVYGYDFSNHKSDPMDFNEHGTHCAGIIAASPDKDTHAEGVAQGVKVMAVQIIGNDEKGFLSDAVEGIKYAVDNGATVLSNSWRVYKSWDNYNPSDANVELLRQAISYAGSKGAIFVAAAGNESVNLDTSLVQDPMWPGGFEGLSNLVVVAASDAGGGVASFSNYGIGHVTVAAPGTDIVSTVPRGKWLAMSGTSMASPLIAGSLARGLSAPMDSAHAIQHLIETSASQDVWKGKIKSGGVIDLVDYLK